MPNNNLTLDNKQTLLIEKARTYSHQLQSCRAAFRFLEGAVLTGLIDPRSANKIVPLMVKYEQNLNNRNNFANDFFELADKPLFKESVNKKYKYLLQSFPKKINKRVLVIDDKYSETGWKQVFTLLFGNDMVIGQNNSKSALNYLQNNSNKILCILLDLKLPDTEDQGIALLKKINKDYPQIPIIIFSISDSIIYARQVFKLGAWDFFPKEPKDTVHRNPVDYFINFFEILKRIWDYDKNYVEPYWQKINDLENYLRKYNSQQGSGLSQLALRELKKAYKHFIFNEMSIFTPSFLEMNQYDEVIYCCSKAFESYLRLYAVETGLNKERRFIIKINDDLVKLDEEERDILKTIRGLKDLIKAIEINNNKFKLAHEWFVDANMIVKKRNRFMHGYLKDSSYKASKTKSADKEITSDFFDKTLRLIFELQTNLENLSQVSL